MTEETMKQIDGSTDYKEDEEEEAKMEEVEVKEGENCNTVDARIIIDVDNNSNNDNNSENKTKNQTTTVELSDNIEGVVAATPAPLTVNVMEEARDHPPSHRHHHHHTHKQQQPDKHRRHHPARNSVAAVLLEQPSSPHSTTASSTTSSGSTRKSKRNDDCLRGWSFVACLMSTIAWIVSMVLLLDCRFIFLSIETTLITPTAVVVGAAPLSTAVLATMNTTTVTTVLDAEPIKFGLWAYQDFEVIYHNTTILDTADESNNDNNSTSQQQNYKKISIVTVDDGQCVGYPEEEDLDYNFTVAQGCATAACVLGGWMSFGMWCIFCCRFFCLVCPDFLLIANYLITLPVLQGLAMMLYKYVCFYSLSKPPLSEIIEAIAADNENMVVTPYCGIAREGVSYPFAIILWILTGCLFAFLRPRKKDDFSFFSHDHH